MTGTETAANGGAVIQQVVGTRAVQKAEKAPTIVVAASVDVEPVLSPASAALKALLDAEKAAAFWGVTLLTSLPNQ